MLTNRSLLTNIASLGALQGFNFALTLVTLPYLTRTLGVTGWGTVVFVQLIINYLIWVSNWGFYLGATRKISTYREDRKNLSRVFLVTWTAQWLITSALLLILLVGVAFLPELGEQRDFYLAGCGILLGNVLMPLWFLNGLEKIKESALIQMAVKVVALPFIFIYVEQTDDIATYLWINSTSSVVVGLAVALWLYHSKLVDLTIPRYCDVRTVIVNESHLFLSSMLANLNSAIVPTSLGIFGGATELGYFNLADRARSAAITVLHPITHALFPRMCYLFSNEKIAAMRMIAYSCGAMLSLSLIMSACLLLFSNQIISALGGNAFQEADYVLKLLALSPVFTSMSAFIIHQILIPTGTYRGVISAAFYTLLLNLILVYPAVQQYGASGGAVIVMVTEIFAIVFLISYTYKRKVVI